MCERTVKIYGEEPPKGPTDLLTTIKMSMHKADQRVSFGGMGFSMGKKYRNRRRRFVEYRNRECWMLKKKDVTQLTMTVDNGNDNDSESSKW